MDYKAHTKKRYRERFHKELTDIDYYNLCEICRKDQCFEKKKANHKAVKMIIKYKDDYMWCVLSNKSKIVKTVFPIKNSKHTNQ
jgi:hypothetical protein